LSVERLGAARGNFRREMPSGQGAPVLRRDGNRFLRAFGLEAGAAEQQP
jgi:hypothetical protein